MKSLFILASVLAVLSLAMTYNVEAQKRKIAVKTIEGVVTGHERTRHWIGFKIESGGKRYTFAAEYRAGKGTNPTVAGEHCCDVGTRVRLTYTGSVARHLLNVTHIGVLGTHKTAAAAAGSNPASAAIKKGIEPIPDSEMAVIEMESSTSYGTIKIELYSNIAPKMVARFKELARQGFYDRVAWHRVNRSIIQSGDPLSKNDDPADDGMGKSDKADLVAEFSDIPFDAGIIGAARRADNNSANSQFFITLKREPAFDERFTIFGKVIDGMTGVRSIAATQPKDGERPIKAIRIKRISIVPLAEVPGAEMGFPRE